MIDGFRHGVDGRGNRGEGLDGGGGSGAEVGNAEAAQSLRQRGENGVVEGMVGGTKDRRENVLMRRVSNG